MGCDITSLLQEFESRGKVHSRKESNESDPQTRRDLRAAVAKLSIALEDSGDTIDLITYIVMCFFPPFLLFPKFSGSPADDTCI